MARIECRERNRIGLRGRIAVVAVVLVVAGCNWFEDATKPDKKKPRRARVVVVEEKTQTQEEIERTQFVQLSFEPPLRAPTCFVHFVPPSGGRPGVLQVSTAQNESDESYPSVFIRAVGVGEKLEDLIDSTFPATIQVATSPNATVWHTLRESPAEIKIAEAADGHVVGLIQSATLVSSADGKRIEVSGRFEGTVQ